MSLFDEITINDLKEHLNTPKTLLVDVRNQDEVIHGIIESAIHIPLASLPSEYKRLIEAEHVIFYCHSGIRSAHAAAFLKQQEYSIHTYNLVGGIVAWRHANLPLVMKA